MRNLIFIAVLFIASRAEPLNRINLPVIRKPISLLPSRRILKGRLVGDTRPYMVYLRAAPGMDSKLIENNWLCGGVIINERYILTSAACIEDVKLFYVVSGTHKWIPPDVTDNECIKNGAKRAIWKCVPKTYSFDGSDFNNINWMIRDIAIIKVEDDFNFERKILGCDFIPQKIDINTDRKSLENSGTMASIAGWGSTKRFANTDKDSPEIAENSVDLLETDVVIISKKGCKNHWDSRYHDIIDNYMICTKDSTDFNIGSNECMENVTNCKVLDDLDEDYFESKSLFPKRRMIQDPSSYIVHTADHRNYRKHLQFQSGGFCENDHGGPLVVGEGKNAVVIGIMSACQTNVRSQKCFGPFLFTSVFNYWDLINYCSTIEMTFKCRKLIQSSDAKFHEIDYNWTGRPIPKYPGKLIGRSYAQTPLHPIWSPLNTFSLIPSTTTQNLLQYQSNISSIYANLLRSESLQSPQKLKFDQSDTHVNVSTSIVTTSQETTMPKFSTTQKIASSVSPSSSHSLILQQSLNPKGEVLDILNATDKVSTTRKTRRDNKYLVFQQWQERYWNYLRRKT